MEMPLNELRAIQTTVLTGAKTFFEDFDVNNSTGGYAQVEKKRKIKREMHFDDGKNRDHVSSK